MLSRRCSLPRFSSCAVFFLLPALFLPAAAQGQGAIPIPAGCNRLLIADVVAFDQPFFWNRLGAVQPQGMIYALRRDVRPISGTVLSPGNVQLRPDKRPRPMILRMNVGDCMRIAFQNLLASIKPDQEQPSTRWASIHAVGIQLQTIDDDGSFVGQNRSSLVDVGQNITYFVGAPDREGEHVIFSAGATNGGEGDGGSTNPGLFGAIIVEPAGSAASSPPSATSSSATRCRSSSTTACGESCGSSSRSRTSGGRCEPAAGVEFRG